jgi:membrane protease YdiL (CAAX protease family)
MRKKIGLILTLVTLIQILFISMISLFVDLSQNLKYPYITVVYIILAVLIFLERKNLGEFNLDRASVLILIFSSIFRRRLGVENESFYLLVLFGTGLVMFISVIRNWSQIPKTSFRWLAVGVFIGFIALVPVTFIETIQSTRVISGATESYGPFWDVVGRMIYHLSFSVPMEEVFFRGFLWGYLRKLDWNENKIFWTQGVLFWLSHLGGIGSPLTFFLSIPILTFILSELTKRSGRISPSILFHLVVNSMISVFILMYA